MNKKIFLLAIILLLIITIPAVFLVIGRRIKQNQSPPAQQDSFNKLLQSSNLNIVSTFPQNQSKDIPTNTSINIVFNTKPATPTIVNIKPSVDFRTSFYNETVLVTFLANLEKNTLYTVTVNNKDLSSPTIFSFTTTNQSTTGTGPNPTFFQEYEDSQRKNTPDLFLSNKVPYSTSSFSINSNINRKTGVFSFIVALIGDDMPKSKEDAVKWMQSLELTINQIQSLNISYQREVVVKLKDRLPHDGIYSTINYDPRLDKTTIIIDQKDKDIGEQEVDSYLKSNGIEDRSWINNLTIEYL